MVSGLFHIRLNSSEENKDKGFFSLMTSGTSVVCLKDEEYIVKEEAMKKLKSEGIQYEPVDNKEVVCDFKKKEKGKDATETKI